jgi:2,3-bisphosphoglycerate-independent phosphoglycerate mutase
VLDQLCSLAVTGELSTIPKGFHPGSEIANMNILGYDPSLYFSGRGVLEAAALNIAVKSNELVFRCNLVTVEEGRLMNHSAGHISNEEAGILISFLNKELSHGSVRFSQGVSYRNLMMLEGGDANVRCFPPHDHPGTSLSEILPVGTETAQHLRALMEEAGKLLDQHPVNQLRREKGLAPANGIWPWSPGRSMVFPSFKERWGIDRGAVISAVDLLHGIGRMASLTSIHVEGATGLFDTNYEGKAAAALEALKNHDFVFLHVEAADEAGHEGDYELKKRVVEDFDKRLLKPLWAGLQALNDPFALALLPDHPTPCSLRTHTSDPVPFLMIKPGLVPDKVCVFDEFSVKQGKMGLLHNGELLQLLFS